MEKSFHFSDSTLMEAALIISDNDTQLNLHTALQHQQFGIFTGDCGAGKQLAQLGSCVKKANFFKKTGSLGDFASVVS